MINNSVNKIAIYPGRFHPFHKGHQASYQYLQNQFGADNVFIGTSNVVAPLTSPFSFEDKKMMMTMLGIPEDKIVQVKNPYRSEEITAKLDQDNTVLIFGLSEKDVSRFTFTKKDGSKSYMQPYPKDEMQLKSMKDHAYVVLTPTIDFKVGGDTIKSASQIRSMYIKADDTQRRLIIKDMYGKADSKIKELFDKKLGIAESLSLLLTTLKESKDVANIRKIELALEMEKTAKQIEERDLDEATPKKAVNSRGKVQRYVTAHGLKYAGKQYKEIDMELEKIDNGTEMVTFKIIAPTELFTQFVKSYTVFISPLGTLFPVT